MNPLICIGPMCQVGAEGVAGAGVAAVCAPAAKATAIAIPAMVWPMRFGLGCIDIPPPELAEPSWPRGETVAWIQSMKIESHSGAPEVARQLLIGPSMAKQP